MLVDEIIKFLTGAFDIRTAMYIFLGGGVGAILKHYWPENPEQIMKVNEKPADTIRRICQEQGLNPSLALRVAQCESGMNPNAKNFNNDGSIDRGLFQINSKYHPEVSADEAFDAEFSSTFFCNQFKKGLITDWNASKSCWGS